MKTLEKLGSGFLLLGSMLAATCISAAAQAPKPSDYGVVSFVNSGAAAAQEPFLRGLAALHDFEWQAAQKNFRKAESIDPNFAMAYWGEAMSYNDAVHFQQNTEAGRAALNKLAPTEEGRLEKCGAEREREYMRAVDILYNAAGSKNERDFKYSDAMAALYHKYPNDVDAGALYALSLLGTAHNGRDFSIYMKSLAVLEPLFCGHPYHPGVDHYLIHSVDDPIHAPLGLQAALNYSKVALKAAHAQHMTSHIFVAMGMWDDAVKANEIATTILNEQSAQNGKPPTVCGHYNLWLEYGYLEQGRMHKAKEVLDACRTAALAAPVKESSSSGKSSRDTRMMPMASPQNRQLLLSAYAQMRLRYLLDSGNWSGEVAQWRMPEGADAGTRLSFLFAQGYGAIERHDVKGAHEALEAMAAMSGGGPSGVGTGAATAADYAKRAAILQQELQAMIDEAQGNRDEGIALMRKATAAENAMPFEYGPPFIDKPTEELLGEMLLDAQKPQEARQAFEAALTRTPQRTQALLGLARAEKSAGDNQAAQDTDATLRKIWHSADSAVGLPL